MFLLCFVSCVDFLVLMPLLTHAVPIPCLLRSTFVIESNQHYTLENCAWSDAGMPPFIYIVPSSTTASISNMTLDVRGGGVLPLITFNSSLTSLTNVSVSLHNIRVGPYEYVLNATDPECSVVSGWSVSQMVISNVSLAVVDSTFDITTRTTVALSGQAALLSLYPGDFAQLRGIALFVQGSIISFRYNGGSPQNNYGVFSLRVGANCTIDGVELHVLSSSVLFGVNQSEVIFSDGYEHTDMFFFTVLSESQPGDMWRFNVSNVNVVVSLSFLDVSFVTGGVLFNGTNGSGTATVVGSRGGVAACFLLRDFNRMLDCNITLRSSLVNVASFCWYSCETVYALADLSSVLLAFLHTTNSASGLATFLYLACVNTTVIMSAGNGAILLDLSVTTRNAVVELKATNASLTSGGSNFDGQFAVVAFINGTDSSNLNVTIVNAFVKVVMDSNNGVVASMSLIVVAASVSHTAVVISASTLSVRIIPFHEQFSITPVLPGVFNSITMVTGLISIAPTPAPTAAVMASIVLIRDSTVEASHMCNLPPASPATSLVVSLVCAVGTGGAFRNSTLHISNTSVQRSFDNSSSYPQSWLSAFDLMMNVTTLVHLSDLSGPLSTLAQSDSFFASLISLVIVNTTVERVNITVDNNCVVAYVPGVAPLVTDVVSFINLPTQLNESQLLVAGGMFRLESVTTMSSPTPTSSVSFGTAIGVVATSSIVDSIVVVQHQTLESAVSALLDVVYESLAISGALTSFSFVNVSLVAATSTTGQEGVQDMPAIGSRRNHSNAPILLPTAFTAEDNNALLRLPTFYINTCRFHQFSTIMSSSVATTAMAAFTPPPPKHAIKFLTLGCNLWDDKPLPLTAVVSSVDRAFYASCVSYPPSSYNATLHCAGLQWTDSDSQSIRSTRSSVLTILSSTLTNNTSDLRISATRSVALVVKPFIGLMTRTRVLATNAASVASYINLIPLIAVRGRGAVSKVQRAMMAIHLAALCSATTQSPMASDETGSQQQSLFANDAVNLFGDLFFNPISLSIPVSSNEPGDDGSAAGLNSAAGTVVGNTALTLLSGLLMHMITALLNQKSRSGQQQQQRSCLTYCLLAVVPEAFAPGSFAGTLSNLFQSTVAAMISLIASQQATAASIVCGVALGIPWVGYLVYGSCWVVWLGRPHGCFLLRCERESNHDQGSSSVGASRLSRFHAFATLPLGEWMMSRSWSRAHHDKDVAAAAFLVDHLKPIFEAFTSQREWYCAVDWAVLVVGSVIIGVANVQASNDISAACTVARWGAGCMLVLGLLNLALGLWLRPYRIRIDFWMAVLLGGLECLSIALVLSGSVYAAEIVVTVSSVLESWVSVTLLLLLIVRRWTAESRLAASTDGTALRSSRDNCARNTVGHYRTRSSHHSKVAVELQRGMFSATQEMQLRALVELVCSSAASHHERGVI